VADEAIQHTTESALLTAGWRAIESSRSNALFHDPLAAGLAGERGLRIATTRPDGAWVVAIRTVLIDAFVRSAISSGIDTVINLGSGMDTRPNRMDLPPFLDGWRIKEIRFLGEESERLHRPVPLSPVDKVMRLFTSRPLRDMGYARIERIP
jgi:Leucine carboxyl methyltransferase